MKAGNWNVTAMKTSGSEVFEASALSVLKTQIK